ncbi:hypothetical protein [Streptacidiphilus sp. P02-A3a]|nr:hypothetical protein [Streptacidiphilus sp. P02-A3a]
MSNPFQPPQDSHGCPHQSVQRLGHLIGVTVGIPAFEQARTPA